MQPKLGVKLEGTVTQLEVMPHDRHRVRNSLDLPTQDVVSFKVGVTFVMW